MVAIHLAPRSDCYSRADRSNAQPPFISLTPSWQPPSPFISSAFLFVSSRLHAFSTAQQVHRRWDQRPCCARARTMRARRRSALLDSEPLHSLNGLAVLELAQCGLDADQRIRLPTPPTRGPLQCSSIVPGNYFLQRPMLYHCFKPSASHCFRE